MNLYTSYTPEEVHFLLSLTDGKKPEIPFFRGLTKAEVSKITSKYKVFELKKKEVIKEKYDYIWVFKGDVGLVRDSKLTKLSQNSGAVLNGRYAVVSVSESRVACFNIKGDDYITSVFYKNILSLYEDILIIKGL